jgi:hypothetical protein
MGNISHATTDSATPQARASSVNQDVYNDIVNEYLTSIGIFSSAYDPPNTIDIRFAKPRYIDKRVCALRFLWPHCIGIPMLFFDLDANSDVMWWVDLFRPYIDHVLPQACASEPESGVFMFLGWSYLYKKHLTVLHFDPIGRIQTFFDPMQHFTPLMSGVSLATGFTPHTKFYEIPLQMALEWYHHRAIPLGICSAICMLMVVCCRRFGTSDIYGIHEIVAHLVWNRQYDISTIRYNLWLFYIQLGRVRTLPDLLRHLGLVGSTGSRTCTATSSGSVPCKGPVCAGSPYCPFHARRLLTAHGIRIEGTPTAVYVDQIKLHRSACTRRSAWAPPGPHGMVVWNAYPTKNRSYVHIERTLLSVSMAILQQTVERMVARHSDVNTIPLLYIRITGFTFPVDVFHIVHLGLDWIARAAWTTDLCIDVDFPVEALSVPSFVERTKSTIQTIKSIRTATLLLWDTKH